MNEPADRPAGLLPRAGAAYLALAALQALLAAAVPGGVLDDPLLPGWMRASLLAGELALTSALAAGAVAAAALLGRVHRSLAALATGLLLAALGASWAAFALGGQFLDGEGLAYGAANAGAIARHAASLHPLLLFGVPPLALAAGALACGPLGAWWSRRPERLRRAAAGAAVGLLALAGLGAAWGERASRKELEKRLDPVQGIAYSGRELYTLGRERRAGPLSHAVSGWWRGEEPIDLEPALPLAETRRPQVPLEAWAASADPVRVRPLDVIVVLVDSLRPDALEAWGSTRPVMPALDALARRSRIFLDCVTTASHTDYAVPAIFSSHWPLRSKDVHRHPEQPPYPRVLLHDLLKARGYRTGYFSAQNEDWGRMRAYLSTPGLDVLEDARSLGDAADRAGAAWTVDDARAADAALRWIGSDRSVPFLAVLNLQSGHLPFAVPAGFQRPFGAAAAGRVELTAAGFPREQAAGARDLYADALAYADRQLARLLAAADPERTVLIVTSDHGEAFYEHGLAAHANGVYEEVVRVPLVVAAPGLAAGQETRPAGLLDLAPTLLGLLGLPPHPSHQGLDLLGTDPVAEPRSRFLVSDTPWRTHLGVRRGRFKMIYDADRGRFALYDLEEDPGETRDASEAFPAEARELRGRLAAWRNAQLGYYANPLRQAAEYPPVLEDR